MCSFPTSRDPLKWPFARDSIWNMPVGSDAVYVPANIQPPTCEGMTEDPDILILTPEAPLTAIYYNYEGWSGRSRCEPQGGLFLRAPMPVNFAVPHFPEVPPHTPNHAAAILMPDGRTIKQNQPFHRCRTGGPAVSQFIYPDVDIYGDGIQGAHGGSGMSSLGGTLRLGELVPGGVIRHALKINLYGAKYLHYALDEPDGQPGYRWPSVKADGYAGDPDSPSRYQGANPAVRMGSLLALHRDADLEGNELALETEPAKILARAFQDYGAYVVDDTARDSYALATEYGPDGRAAVEFQEIWGFPFEQKETDTPWARDMACIFTNLYAIDNNGPGSIGGGGTPCQPLAPPFNCSKNNPINKPISIDGGK